MLRDLEEDIKKLYAFRKAFENPSEQTLNRAKIRTNIEKFANKARTSISNELQETNRLLAPNVSKGTAGTVMTPLFSHLAANKSLPKRVQSFVDKDYSGQGARLINPVTSPMLATLPFANKTLPKTKTGDVLELGKSFLFGNPEETRQATSTFSKIREGSPVTDKEREAYNKFGEQQTINFIGEASAPTKGLDLDGVMKQLDNFKKPATRKAAKERLEFLVHYTDRLVKEGHLKPEQAKKIGVSQAYEILESLKKQDTYEQIISDVKGQVGLLDYFRSPAKVLKEVGLGKEAENIRTAWNAKDAMIKDQQVHLGQWQKALDLIGEKQDMSPEMVNKRIFKALDGQPIELTKPEQFIANDVRAWYEDWANKLALPQERRITEYVPHVFERGQIKKEFDYELAHQIFGNLPKGVYNPFEQARMGKLGYVEDFIRVSDAYLKRGAREFHMTPVLRRINDYVDNNKDLISTRTYEYIQGVLSDVNMRPAGIDELIDTTIKKSPIGYRLGQRPTNYLSSKVSKAIYRGALWFNPKSAIQNLAQQSNNYAVLGEKHFMLGWYDFLENNTRNGAKELFDEGVLENRFLKDNSLKLNKTRLEKIDPYAYKLFDTAERINRGVAYYGAKRKALDQGMPMDKAKEYAREVVRKTNFEFSPVDTPAILKGDTAKMLGQFSSYPLKQGEFLAELAKDKNLLGLIRYTASTYAFYKLIGEALGMGGSLAEKAIPQLGFSPAVDMASNIKGLVENAMSGSENEYETAKQKKNLTSSAWLLAPAGVQTKRTLQGAMANFESGNISSKGSLKYPINPDLHNRIKVLVFGPSSDEAARIYYDEGLSALTEKETKQWKAAVRSGEEPYKAWVQIQKGKIGRSLRTKSKGATVKERQKLLRDYEVLRNKLDQFAGE